MAVFQPARRGLLILSQVLKLATDFSHDKNADDLQEFPKQSSNAMIFLA